ncbi:MAG: hypothetical protein K0Q95_664 [Bacteroidota bacterium]|jgi:hypothetical protein|nr:hypothetical protein [Bacteroidota bacterium]
MKRTIPLFLFLIINLSFSLAQISPTCITAIPIWSNSTTFASPTNITAETGPNYACLSTQPNPAWFYLKIENPGNLIMTISQYDNFANGLDVDFICWGPFASPTAPCTGMLTGPNSIDCSYSTAVTEQLDINNAIAGMYYIIMITNYSNVPGSVNFTQTGGTASLSADDACVTNAFYNSPVCVDGTLQLVATNHLGAGNYNWTGPNGFSSALKNPVITPATVNASGYYRVTYTSTTPACNYSDSVLVTIDTCGTLTGRVYADLNSSCAQDSSENYLPNAQIKLSQAGMFVAMTWTDPYGYYFFDVPAGSYTIEVIPSASYSVTCPASLAHLTTVTGTAINTENFAVSCNANNLIASSILVSGIAFFPGQTNTMFLNVANSSPECNNTPSPGQVTLVMDPLVSYAGPAPSFTPPDIINGDTLKWNVADINSINLYGNMYAFQYTTAVTATGSDTVHFTLMISPVIGDADPANNIFTRSFIVGNSYDPNNKLVEPSGVGQQGFIPASTAKLEYIINFQNTGTAPAFNIYILDTLDADVDVSSLEVISSSHPQTTSLLPGNVLKFNFSNIMLADSSSNEAGSHGFVKYSISPDAGLQPGDEIRNTAFIYFDFNSPIVTNTALNTIEFPLGMKDEHNYELAVFPNPAQNKINVMFEDLSSKSIHIEIMNIAGKVIYNEQIGNFNGRYNKSLDLNNHSNGVYLLQITTDRSVIHYKLIKN